MRNPLASPGSTSLGLLLARVPLGAYFVMAGFSKFTGPGGVRSFVSQFAGAVPDWIPDAAGESYLRALPYAEIIVGASLALGVMGRLGGLAGAVMLATYMAAVTGVRSVNHPFQPGVIYLGVALLVALAGPGAVSMDRVKWGDVKPKGDGAGGGDRPPRR